MELSDRALDAVALLFFVGAAAKQRSALRDRRAKGISRRILALSVAAVVLYGVAPAVLEVFGAYRRLTDVDPAWWIVVVAMSAAGTWCMCAVQRLTLNGARWFPVRNPHPLLEA